MKFKSTPTPKLGDTRQRIAYAWLPTKIGPITVWLETYIRNEVFTNDGYDKVWLIDSMATNRD